MVDSVIVEPMVLRSENGGLRFETVFLKNKEMFLSNLKEK
jgi:hypothetical protein